VGTIEPVSRSKANSSASRRYGPSGPGFISIFFGVGLCALACLGIGTNPPVPLPGGPVPLAVIGLGFIGGGVLTNRTRVCSACKRNVPEGASICGHCRTELNPES
jgi:hypothetical protein